MIINAITIENFKSIKEPVRIELKPITLLFGPNSVGKSTIIQALHYAREIIKGKEPDIDRTETGGDTVRLGGFYNLVHNHDTDRAIRLKFELSLPDYLHYDLFEETADTIEEILAEFPGEADRIKEFFQQNIQKGNSPWVELVIRQDSVKNGPYVSSQTIGFGDKTFITLTANSSAVEMTLFKSLPLFPIKDGKSIAELFFFETGDEEQKDKNQMLDATNTWGRLPASRVHLNVNGTRLRELFEKDLWEQYNLFESILNAVWQSIVAALQEDLDDFRYIGPLRVVPDADFVPGKQNDPSRWANGSAAWDSLVEGEWDIGIVNEWLSNQFFNTGYQIVREQIKEINLDGKLYKQLIGNTKIREKICKQLEQLPTKTNISIQKEHVDIIHHAKDIGIGISQLLPIIPLSLGGGWDHEGVIAIEQPELHIHPAMQVVLGDLFIEGLDYEVNMPGRKRFIIETHSEHLLLRLLRRIRDPRKYSMVVLTPNHVGIHFLEPGKHGLIATRIRVNEEGDFKDPWPRGFFNERSEELF